MRKTTFTFLFILFLVFSANAQITITHNEVPPVGTEIILNRDTLAEEVDQLTGGAHIVWDMSNILTHEVDSNYFEDPANTTFAADFPDANYALANNFLDGYAYAIVSDSAFELIGLAGSVPGLALPPISVPFNPTQTQWVYPHTLGTAFSDFSEFNVKADGSAFQVDSIWLRHTERIDDTIDGYGVLKTPNGTFQCLRSKRTTITVDSIQVKLPFIGWNLFQEDRVTTVTYNFITLEDGGQTVTVEVDDNDLPVEAEYTNTLPIYAVAQFDYVEGTPLAVDFTDMSENGPITDWSWDFGDGNSSSMQNPNHAYAAAGTYTVCLTVTSANGSHEFCQDVVIGASSIEDLFETSVSLYPNPASQVATLDISTVYTGEMSIELLDQAGRVVRTIDAMAVGGSARVEVKVNDLAAGIYGYVLRGEQAERLTGGKLVVE